MNIQILQSSSNTIVVTCSRKPAMLTLMTEDEIVSFRKKISSIHKFSASMACVIVLHHILMVIPSPNLNTRI